MGTSSIRECTPTGATIQEITTPFSESFVDAIGIAFDYQGRLNINYDDHVNTKSYLGTLDPNTGIWQTTPIGLPTSGDADRDLSAYRNYLFRRNVRINVQDFSQLTFDTGFASVHQKQVSG